MKIFSNFDTGFREKAYNQRVQDFDTDQVFLIMRSRYYLMFRVIIPFIFYIIVLVALFSAAVYYANIDERLMALLTFVWVLVVWFRVFHKFLKYKYDFTIVTPRGIFTYKQKGILNSQIKELPTRRIKAIQVCRASLLQNIFGYGSIDIMSDISDNAHM